MREGNTEMEVLCVRCVGVTPALELCDCWSLSQLAQLGGPRYLCMCVCAWVGAIRHMLV